MSIVICAIDKNKYFYIALDLRAIRNGVVTDNYQKVFELKTKVYFGMTGIAEAGIPVLEQLRTLSDQSTLDIIAKADEIVQPSSIKLTVMLAGIDEQNNFFIWQKNNRGEITNADVNDYSIVFSISSNSKINEFNAYFTKLIKAEVSIEQAIETTINFASKRDKTISPTFTLIKHP